MAGDLLLGIDHGGSTTTALLFDPARGKLASHSVRMPKRAPAVGLVEHDAEDFVRTAIHAATETLRAGGRDWADVAAVGLANQGETSIAWSAATGLPLAPALSWEDRRTVPLCAELARQGVDRLVRERTGLLLDPYFSASKYAWLLRNAPGAAETAARGELRLGGTDAYTLFRLTGGDVHVTDIATASRTALLNLRTAAWDAALLAAFGIPASTLPALHQTCGDRGRIRHPDIPVAGLPVTANAVDAHAALFAHGCWTPATVKMTYGTGAFIEVNTGETPAEPDGRLLVLIAWEIERREHLLEGGVFSVGSAIDWAVEMGWLPSAAASSDLALGATEAPGLAFVPCLTGLAAPHWDSAARGCIAGLGLDTSSGQLARALLDGIAFQCADVVRALDDRLVGGIREVRADGGPTRNRYLMQRQADVLGMSLAVTEEPHMTALGVALLAAIGAGRLTRAEAGRHRPAVTIYEPRLSADERDSLWDRWRRNVAWARDGRGR